MYSLLMVVAILFALWWSGRRVAKAGGDSDAFQTIGLVAIICGIVGARLYHVITEHARYFGPGSDPWDVFKVWNGGLSVIGAIIGGGIGLWVMCRWRGIDTAAVADCVAPTLFIAQAIGRVGNYFNQEAFGKPTTLPWGLQVDPSALQANGLISYLTPGCTLTNCPVLPTFHPTFLYEGLWNILGCVLLLWAIRKFKLQHGKAMASYVLWYAFGRFFIELIRIDPVSTIYGLRINDWTSGVIFLVALGILIFLMKKFPTSVDKPLAGMAEKWNRVKPESDAGEPAPVTTEESETPSEEAESSEEVEKPTEAAEEPVTEATSADEA